MKLFKEAVPFKRRMQLHCPRDTYTKLLNRLLRLCMPDLPPDSQNPSSLISSPYRARATATFLLPRPATPSDPAASLSSLLFNPQYILLAVPSKCTLKPSQRLHTYHMLKATDRLSSLTRMMGIIFHSLPLPPTPSSKVLLMSYKAPPNLFAPSPPLPSLLLLFTHSATLTTWCKQAWHAPTSGPLHKLFPLPEILSPDSLSSHPSFRFGLTATSAPGQGLSNPSI